MNLVNRAAAALAVFVVLTGASAFAQVPDPFARELARQLARIDQVLAGNAYSRAAGPFAGGLNPRMARRYPLSLRAGQDYRIVGVCDSRCSDLDLRLIDPSNAVVAQDVLNDDTPVLTVRPLVTGQHSIEVVMYGCSAQPCWYAFNVYSR